MAIAVLGPLTIDGEDSHGARDRVVLEALVVRADEAVDKQVLADALWGEVLPASWPKMIQGCIVRLRRLLPPGSIETTPYGYRLVVHEDQLDARRFERLLVRAREHLQDQDPDRASYVVTEALALWRGRPLPDLDDWEPGRAEANRLAGLRMDAEELRVEAEIVAGRSRTVVEEARTLTRQAPFRERRWALLARTLYHSGRQMEALDVLAGARRMLREELGLDPGAELTSLEEAILRQDPELSGAKSAEVNPVCPYRGLLPYEAEDAESFFGRDTDVAACLEKLRQEGVLVVVGPSGTGKSSLVRAGVIASLERDGTAVLFTTPGHRPLDSLAGLPSHPPFPVLVVDQAEEAVTLCADPEERAAYLTRIEAYAGPAVLALRADRLGDLSTNPRFARLLERGLYLPGPMSEEDLRAAIEGPARHAGLRLEPGLVDLLVREVDGEPAALPLLSHVLRQTWELREGRTLTVDGYRQSGGIRNALAQTAESLYDGLDDRQRTHLRDLFLRLVAPDEDNGPVRTRVARTRLAFDESHEDLIEDLINARLLSSDEDDVQIAHEALAREWPRLRGWLEEDVEGQRIFRHLSSTAETWDSMGSPDSELYRGVRLGAAVDWAGRSGVEFTETERAFLAASTEGAERELHAQGRSNRRLRLSLAGIGVLLVVALVAGFLAVDAAKGSHRQAVHAATAARVADSRRLSAQALVVTEPDLSLLLGVEAVRRDDSLAARSTLYSLLGKTSQLRAEARQDGGEGLAVTEDGASVTTIGAAGVTTYDTAELHRTRTSSASGSALARSPDGRLLAYADLRPNDVAPSPHPVRLLDASSLAPAGHLGGTTPGWFVNDALAFSADGQRLAAGFFKFDAGDVAGAQVWDVQRPGRPLKTLPVDGVRIQVSLSRTGETLYVATRGPDVLRSYDVSSGRLLATRAVAYLSERNPPLELSPDGSLLASSQRDGVGVFDAHTLRPKYVLPGLGEGVTSLVFSDDGRLLASGFASGKSIVWDLSTRRPIQTLEGHSKPVEDLAFGSDRSLYTIAADGQLLAWRLGTPGFVAEPTSYPDNPKNAYVSSPSPDGRTVAYLTYAGEVQFRDVQSGRLTAAHPLGRYSLAWWGAAWSPDSREFTTSGGARDDRRSRHTLEVWDPRTGDIIYRDLEAGVDTVDYTRNGRRLVAVSENNTVSLLDRKTRRPIGDPIKVDPWSYLGSLALTPDGRTLYLPLEVGPLQAVHLDTGEVTPTSFDVSPSLIAFSPDGGQAVVMDANGKWGTLPTKQLGSARPRWTIPARSFAGPNEPVGVTWSADASQLFTFGPGSVDIWDGRTLQHLAAFTVGNADQTPDARVLADGHTLLIAHPGGQVLTWDLRPEHLLDVACKLAGRNLTRAEWSNIVGSLEYSKPCPNLD